MNRQLTIAFFFLLLPLCANSHHSTLGIYDKSNIIEIEGVVTVVRWRNPHPSYKVTVKDSNDVPVEWMIEIGAVSTMRVRGLNKDFLKVGDHVKLSGEASARGRNELYARNLLREDGEEILTSALSQPIWSSKSATDFNKPINAVETVRQAKQNANGIFRVWTSVLGDPNSFPLYMAGHPMTEAAKRLKEQWEPRKSPYINCGKKGMPYIMTTPYPLEFLQQDNKILLRFEELGWERVINMLPAAKSQNNQSLLGYSIGQWEGQSLVVMTDKINSPHFYGDGTPQSEEMKVVELFTLSEDETRLDYHVTIDDPLTFTQTLEFNRYWAWRPEIDLKIFQCE